MPDIDCNSEMTSFHRENVTLPKGQQDEMRARRDAGRTRLETGLNEKKHPTPTMVVSQGSYAMRTMVQDAAWDYDIDDGAYFRSEDLLNASGEELPPLAARQRICDALSWDGRLKHEAEVLKNCVRQPYPDGYHIDVPVYRILKTKGVDGKEVEHFELASGDEWRKSDARAVTSWFISIVGELNAGEADGSQMRRITKLSKYFSRRNDDWKKKTVSGITITKLVTDYFIASPERDDQSLRETWKAIKKALDISTKIAHPVDGSNLAEENDPKVTFFRDCLKGALSELLELDKTDCDRKKARGAWDKVFDTTFFSASKDGDGGGGGGGAKSVVVTSGSTARRNDGGGRFG